MSSTLTSTQHGAPAGHRVSRVTMSATPLVCSCAADVNTAVTRLTPWTHGADFMDIYVRQDQPGGGARLAAAEADLRGRRGGRARPLRRPGRLGCDGARHVRDFGARLRERHRAELHRRGRPALLRVEGAVVLPGRVPVPRPGLAARPAAVRAGRAEPVRQPDHRSVVAGFVSVTVTPCVTRGGIRAGANGANASPG